MIEILFCRPIPKPTVGLSARNGLTKLIVESVGFAKSITMLDRIQCESVAADGIHQKKEANHGPKLSD